MLHSWHVGLLPDAVPGNLKGRGRVPVSGNLGFLLEVRWCEKPISRLQEGWETWAQTPADQQACWWGARGACNLGKTIFPCLCHAVAWSLCSSLCPWCVNYQCCRAGAAAPAVRSEWETGMLPSASQLSCQDQRWLLFTAKKHLFL